MNSASRQSPPALPQNGSRGARQFQVVPRKNKRTGRRSWRGIGSELKLRGWKMVKVDPRSGKPVRNEPGVWVMRYTGTENDEAVRYVKTIPWLVLKARAG